MGFDRVVMLLINSSDMSAAAAAGTAPRTTHWHGGGQRLPCGHEQGGYQGNR